MTETPKPNPHQKDETTSKEAGNGVCGIVMPISTMSEEYEDKHWARVRKILETAIKKSNFTPQVVWSNPEIDVIQSKILQNIYENEIIICDLSNLNPNVMLETGLRLSTKKPTILITDDGKKKPPFDISSIEYMCYPKNLEYNEIDKFIDNLSKKITSVANSYNKGSYKSFVDNYKFEVVNPTTIEVTGEKFILNQIKELNHTVVSLVEKIGLLSSSGNSHSISRSVEYYFKYNGDDKSIEDFKLNLSSNIPNKIIFSTVKNQNGGTNCVMKVDNINLETENFIISYINGSSKCSEFFWAQTTRT